MNDALLARTTITIDTSTLPTDCDSWWIEVRSDRNQTISSTVEVPEAGPESARAEARDWVGPMHWFPVIDVDLSGDWTAYARVDGHEPGDTIVCNGYLSEAAFSADPSGVISIPRSALQHWENSIFVRDRRISVTEFWMRRRVPLGAAASFCVLDSEWIGETRIVGLRDGAEVELAGWTRKGTGGRHSASTAKGSALDLGLNEESDVADADLSQVSTETIERHLSALVGWLVRSVNDTPGHPTEDGFYLFYDLHTRTYRAPQWMWTWGPTLKLLLDCAASGRELRAASAEQLRRVALGAAETTMRFLERSPTHPARDLIKVRWNVRYDSTSGYLGYLSPADTGFLVGWGWMPVYRTTGDPRFLDAGRGAIGAIDRLIEEFTIPPMDFIDDRREWKDFTLDEAGFALEAHAAVFAETGDETVARSAVTLMDHFIARYESPSGLWHREYNYRTDTVAAIAGKTRGQGWAMEGLLALDRIHPGMHYRDRATRMARELIQHQRPDGSWLTILDGDEAEHGVSEKGTALWSLLLYQLYEQTGETEFLYPARNALKWCLEHQYGGPDPNGVGGIPGTSPHSGVVYRNWFPMICGYTCGFAGLAMMKELEIRG